MEFKTNRIKVTISKTNEKENEAKKNKHETIYIPLMLLFLIQLQYVVYVNLEIKFQLISGYHQFPQTIHIPKYLHTAIYKTNTDNLCKRQHEHQFCSVECIILSN